MTTEFRTIRLLLSFFKRHRLAVAASVVLGILSSFAEGVGVALFIPFIQTVTDNAGVSGSASFLVRFLEDLFAGVPPHRRLLIICLGILGAVLAKALLYYLHGVLLSYLDWKMGCDIRARLTNRILSASFRSVERRDSGDLLNTLSTESWNATDALSVLLDIMVTACTLLVYIVLLLLISTKLTVLALAAMLCISLTVRLMTGRVKALGQLVKTENAVLATRMLETVEGNKTIRTFGRESHQQRRFEAVSQKLGSLCWKLGCIRGLLDPVYELGGAALLVFILFTSAQDPANLGSALVFIFALYRAQPKMAALDGASVSLRAAAASIDAVTSLLTAADEPVSTTSGTIPFAGVTDAIAFDRASFKYHPDDTFAIQDLSLHFPAGKTTALVGPSGAGKSTIIKLILRLYDVEHGDIRVDGRPLGTLDLTSWREKIAVVSQDGYVFNATVRDNIAYGKLAASDQEIVDAARQANAHEFITALPQGYLTRIGDRGVRLSTGQLQRLTLARAIVRDPDILVLDEATNSVDSISERIIQEALETFAKSRTVIIIAHRFSTIEQADHIVVLEHGRLREQGPLDSLLNQAGLFSQLYALQCHALRTAAPPADVVASDDTLPRHPIEPPRRPPAEPLISVIIPCYNQAGFLGRAIESALSQTYQNREVIVVDDGSLESIGDVVARYPGVICLHQSHQGLAAARNAGIDAANGELLVFLDADDRLLPKALESGLECLRAHPDCGFVFGAHKTVAAGVERPEPDHLTELHGDMYLDMLSDNCVAMHGTILFRRDAVLAAGKYDRTLKASEDYDLCLRVSRRFPAARHRNVVAEYWKHEGNMSGDSGLMLRESLRTLKKQKPALKTAAERAAFRKGIRHWQHYYGEGQWAVVTRNLKARQAAAAARSAFVLLRFAPSVFVAQAATQTARTGRALARAVASSIDTFFNRHALESRDEVLASGGEPIRSGPIGRLRGRRSAGAPVPPVILLYHRVADVESDPWNLAVSRRNFRDHMRLLAEAGACIPLSDLTSSIANRRLPSGSVCITFDDGYSDNLVNAKPLLEEFSLPATFFLTSGYLQGSNDFWWDALERPFFRKERIPSTLQIEIERALLTFDFAGDTEYRDSAFKEHRQWRAWDPPLSKRHLAYYDLWQILHRVPSSTREQLLDTIQDWAGSGSNGVGSACRPLSAQEVRQLAVGPGVEIGGHSVTHPSLPLLDHESQQREIVENKRRLEELLGRRLQHFSYPHGELCDDTVSLLKQAGYEAACTTQAFAVERSVDLFRLPRICVEDWNGEDFARRLKHRFVED